MRIDVFGKDVFNKDNGNGILKIACKSESSDKINCRCLWAVIYFDVKQGIMTACTDCGNYAYMWSETGFEFLKLMAVIHADYLLEKIAKRNKFSDCDTIHNIITAYEETSKKEAVLYFFQRKMPRGINNEFEFIHELEECDLDGLFDDLVYSEVLDYRYPYGAITFAELFVTYVQPKIREVLKTYE